MQCTHTINIAVVTYCTKKYSLILVQQERVELVIRKHTLSLSKGTVTILKAIEPPISTASSYAPGAQAHAPALEAAAKGKNVKRLKCKSGHRPANTKTQVVVHSCGGVVMAIKYQ